MNFKRILTAILLWLPLSAQAEDPASTISARQDAANLFLLSRMAEVYREIGEDILKKAIQSTEKRGTIGAVQLADIYAMHRLGDFLRFHLLALCSKYESSIQLLGDSLRENPKTSSPSFILGVEIFFHAKLVLDENYAEIERRFEENAKLRFAANQRSIDMTLAKGTLERAASLFFDKAHFKKAVEAEGLLEKVEVQRRGGLFDLGYWQALRKESEANALYVQNKVDTQKARRGTLLFLHWRRQHKKAVLFDRAFGGLRSLENFISKAFGFTIGSFQWKKGVMFHRPSIIKDLERELKPMDVLFERARHRVSGVLIPGFWVHNAIYLGNDKDLKRLGVWDDPEFLAFSPTKQKMLKDAIKSGRVIIEALRYGVTLNSLEHFMNIDDFAAARYHPYERYWFGEDNKLTEKDMRKRILLLMRRVGVSYDFTFDIEQSDKLTCSGLVYTTFPEVDFKPYRILGRYTVDPNQVAKMTFESDAAFSVRKIYYNGNELKARQSSLQSEMRSLVLYQMPIEKLPAILVPQGSSSDDTLVPMAELNAFLDEIESGSDEKKEILDFDQQLEAEVNPYLKNLKSVDLDASALPKPNLSLPRFIYNILSRYSEGSNEPKR